MSYLFAVMDRIHFLAGFFSIVIFTTAVLLGAHEDKDGSYNALKLSIILIIIWIITPGGN